MAPGNIVHEASMLRRLAIHLLASLAIGIILHGPAPAVGAEPAADIAALGATLDAWAKPYVERGLLSGNLLIARRGDIVLERSWGMADAGKGLRNSPEIPSCVASINKPLTVILAIKLMEERKLGYTDPLSKWIPDFPQGDSITVEHLLRHRSGIPHRVTTDEDETKPHSASEMVEFAKKAPLMFPPGSQSSYSSAGFSVLARVLELASGTSYPDLLRERVITPLALQHTFHPDANAPDMPRAASYIPVMGGVEPAPFQDLSYLVGAGALFTTTRDLHRILWADVSGQFGEGARQSALRGGKINWNGSTSGYRAFADYDTTTGHAVIFAGNLHCGAVDQVRSTVARLLAGEVPAAPVMPPAHPAVVDVARLRSYEGLFDIAGNPRLAVRATESGLDVNGWALMATGDSTFFSLRDFGTVKAVGNGSGRIERLDWTLDGRTFPCPRVGDLP
jgi:CubicO group peptidase (beta-lactamase class C family)